MIQTVRGAVAPEQLGVTDCHGHLICRPSGPFAAEDPGLVLDDEVKAWQELVEKYCATLPTPFTFVGGEG